MTADDGLSNKAAVVTGAGGGIGRAIAATLAGRGCRLVLADIDAAGLAAVAEELGGGGGPVEVEAVVADVTDPADAAAPVRRATEHFGALDVLVNVVGGSRPGQTVDQLDPAEWERLVAFNLTSTFLMCHHAVGPMAAGGGGAIVNVSSGAGVRGMARNPAYCAAKAGVIGLTKALAIDHGDDGIRVNAVAPGPVRTPLMERNRPPEQIAALARMTLVGRVAGPEEVAATVAFLAGSQASYMTGQTLEVDGGVRGGV